MESICIYYFSFPMFVYTGVGTTEASPKAALPKPCFLAWLVYDLLIAFGSLFSTDGGIRGTVHCGDKWPMLSTLQLTDFATECQVARFETLTWSEIPLFSSLRITPQQRQDYMTNNTLYGLRRFSRQFSRGTFSDLALLSLIDNSLCSLELSL